MAEIEKFHFTTAKGEEITVPYLDDSVSQATARKIRKEFNHDYEALMDAFVDAALPATMVKKLNTLSVRDWDKFITGWTELDKKLPGEFSASSNG